MTAKKPNLYSEPPAADTPLTVQALQEILAQCHPESRIFLQGCDCINQAAKVWRGKPSAYEEYQGQLMLGFGPRGSYIARGWQELAPNPEPPPSAELGPQALAAAQASLEQAAPPPPDPANRGWEPTALSHLSYALQKLDQAQNAAPLRPGPQWLSRPPGPPEPGILAELKAAAADLRKLKQQLGKRFDESLRLTGQLPRPAETTPEERETLQKTAAALTALARNWPPAP